MLSKSHNVQKYARKRIIKKVFKKSSLKNLLLQGSAGQKNQDSYVICCFFQKFLAFWKLQVQKIIFGGKRLWYVGALLFAIFELKFWAQVG